MNGMSIMKVLRFDGRVAIITGAGGGLGKAYALLLASRGCAVVVNDLGGSRSGEGSSHRAADFVVNEIRQAGGKAVANYDSVEFGAKIVEQAIKEFGRLDILINNAGILRDKSFAKMTDEDWDSIMKVHLDGAFSVTKAAWNHFQEQQYGRIIMTSSAAGFYGNYGQTNYAAAKMGLVGFGKTLATEGAKKNIHVNVIAPVAGSRITETVLPAHIIDKIKPDYVAPYVAFLCHESCSENGSVYEVGAGFGAKIRWERSEGLLLKVDDPSFTPTSIAGQIKRAMNFSHPQYPNSMADVDWVGLLKRSKTLSSASTSDSLDFKGQVVLVTGAGGGLGRAYALMFGSLGASVIVNDLGRNREGVYLADSVVNEIKLRGGNASADYNSVTDGSRIIEDILKKYGKIDVIVNNAGILRDKSFVKMTEAEWKQVIDTHLKGTFSVTKAAWPHMIKQNYGRIINTSSAVGLYGNFGQANYSAAKAALIAFSTSLAAEGKKYNILVNAIAPNAGTQMTATIFPQEMVDMLKPEYIAPYVGYLAHSSANLTGCIFEVGSGWFSQVRQQRSKGCNLGVSVTLELVASSWNQINDFGTSVYPKSAQESFSSIMSLHSEGNKNKNNKSNDSLFTYGKKDLILYNLGVGCSEKDLKFVYEGHSSFSAIPTFGVIPAFVIMMNTNMEEYVDNYQPSKLLHGEHFLKLESPFPPEGAVYSEKKVLQVLPKGSGSIVVLQLKTFDSKTKKLLCINEGTIFLRGAKPKKMIDLSKERCVEAVENPIIPSRKSDAVTTQNIAENQAAIYRLSGDYNPLHIESEFARMGGFEKPILHGLCTYGHAAHHVIDKFAGGDASRFKCIKARFTKHVFPGETIQTEMWKLSANRIAFQVKVVERNDIVIGNAFVDLYDVVPKVTFLTESKAEIKAFAIFDKFERVYEGLPRAMKEDHVKKVNGVFQFDIERDGKHGIFHIDLKNSLGKIGKGVAPSGADITIKVKDDDFVELASGRLNGQNAFMKGLVQVRGNMMLAMKLDRVLKSLSGSGTKSKI